MSRTIKIFETTLRDGEQASGVGAGSLGRIEKYALAQLFDEAGFNVIEAGFPISSDGDFEAVSYVSKRVQNAEVAALARAVKGDIKRAYEAIKEARNPRLHTFIAVSPVHMREKLGKSPDEVYQMAINAVGFSKQLLGDRGVVEFSGEDSFRAEPEFLKRVYAGAIEAGATVINVPDTVGYAQPEEVFNLMKFLMAQTPGAKRAEWSFHGHDDLGNAVANSMAAIRAGTHQIEGTINGVGERAGNTALEEVIANLRTRRDCYGDIQDTIDTRRIGYISNQISRLLDMHVQPNKAVVGANAFAHSSGIHQDGVIKSRRTYEIMKPEDWGWDYHGTQMTITPRSGKKAIGKVLENMGYRMSDEELTLTYTLAMKLADVKKKLSAEDLAVILDDEVRKTPEVVKLVYANAMGGTMPERTATVQIMKDGVVIPKVALGNGPIDALYNAINNAVDVEVELAAFELRAVGQGKDVLGEVTTIIRDNGHRYIGRGVSTDIIEASAKAYMNALNKMLYQRINGGSTKLN